MATRGDLLVLTLEIRARSSESGVSRRLDSVIVTTADVTFSISPVNYGIVSGVLENITQ